MCIIIGRYGMQIVVWSALVNIPNIKLKYSLKEPTALEL